MEGFATRTSYRAKCSKCGALYSFPQGADVFTDWQMAEAAAVGDGWRTIHRFHVDGPFGAGRLVGIRFTCPDCVENCDECDDKIESLGHTCEHCGATLCENFGETHHCKDDWHHVSGRCVRGIGEKHESIQAQLARIRTLIHV